MTAKDKIYLASMAIVLPIWILVAATNFFAYLALGVMLMTAQAVPAFILWILFGSFIYTLFMIFYHKRVKKLFKLD